ncbi:MAG: hypothetical protein A2358_03115 [Candidatus Staskawiczbacteria bacterium RIFOXYB1_FULL_37_44]|uniref:RNA polymerase sigma-70 domain-containing protein n=1 Tax=Candidatus Staskawiczbacteria bacterium RIFOXYB1_FULL_37_44 TaxID=1802223 RepID=A0A1G2IWG1_9BACT|nr:MAG: hypothetical protein A2358_03115 [Candidatus Staskawiczbacteria bacterium RIFOXYB1_FULL_37_44]OGZ83595.1 MAG: hypothetical protein A2416_04580 [Candidatus Staskawiczbacteria bacterium RIFOXYC1_FULL_37_52]OGZ88695.1 MAG: hypothetical protein A2581_02835 [Candidatus Staskawiczbacteria bacterium RIFOXYD1_FULL_37_110]OGZ89034.1 MAG: hypothetical protein A2444_00180 [Candidatus Staskawiczbacteria bacterium RIFOXYC2_FULL_37_19]
MVKEVKVNARLQRAITKQFGSTANLCRTWPGLRERKDSQNEISALIHIRMSPLRKDGAFAPLCTLLSEALDILPEKLFPVELYRDVIPFDVETTAFHPQNRMPIRELCRIAKNDGNSFEEAVHKSLKRRIGRVLKTLSYREREIIKLRYGLGDDGSAYTLGEVGHIFKVTYECIRQIENRAIRKLQQPKRSQELIGFLD